MAPKPSSSNHQPCIKNKCDHFQGNLQHGLHHLQGLHHQVIKGQQRTIMTTITIHTSSGIIIIRAPIIIHRRTTKDHHHPCKGPSSMWAISICNLHQRTIIRGSNMTMTIMTTIINHMTTITATINHISILGIVTTARVTHIGDKASNICCWHQ